MTPEERFWSKVDKRGIDDCWEWRAGKSHNGYGQCYDPTKKKTTRAHRLAFSLYFGPIPMGLYILHQCNNPGCCNPSHLYPGTHTQNMRDAAASNSRKGARCFRSKLTDAQVVEIRALYATGRYLQKELGVMFGVQEPAIHKICARKRWVHIP